MEAQAPFGERKRPLFGGHETFVFRQGWLKKGVDLVEQSPTIFSQADALVRLGVGKNMVRSIRYWCLATGLVEALSEGPKTALRPTPLAESLLADTGRDPYLEDIGTLWLLHWQLVSGAEYTYAWHETFTRFGEQQFTKQRLTHFIEQQLQLANVQTTSRTIEREVDVCLRMYSTTKSKARGTVLESLDCPLVELGLIRPSRDERTFTFSIGPKPLLPVEVFGYALLQYLSQIANHRRTVAVDECVYLPGSPGQAFKLDENSVVDYLEILEDRLSGAITLQETAGLRQIYLHDWPMDNLPKRMLALLRSYYG